MTDAATIQEKMEAMWRECTKPKDEPRYVVVPNDIAERARELGYIVDENNCVDLKSRAT